MPSVKAIDSLLPQTQCGECGFSGCMPYAEALAQSQVSIDKCPPGGVATVKALGTLLGINPQPFLPAAEMNTRKPAIAAINESECIGCTKCIQACPVDAIIGGTKLMHSVLQHECTGCGLCVEPCPVDCIEMLPSEEHTYDKALARTRYLARKTRILREEHQKQQIYREKKQLLSQGDDKQSELKAKQDYILQALSRVRAKKDE